MNAQIFVNIIIEWSLYSLSAVGFTIIYQTTHIFHFSYAIVFSLGAYFTFLLNSFYGFPLIPSILFSIFFSLVLGSLMEVFIYRLLREKQSSTIILLLSSLGIYIVLQNLISLFFGDDAKSIRFWEVREGIKIAGAYITPIQIILIIISIILIILVSAFLSLSKTGKAMRAVASDSVLAKYSGINSDRIILISFAFSSALAGIAGILVSLDVDMTPTMGMGMFLMGVVVMIIGGVGSIWGIIFGSLLLATAQNLAIWYISSQWMDTIAFLVLLVFLLFKPEGLMGKKLRKTNV